MDTDPLFERTQRTFADYGLISADPNVVGRLDIPASSKAFLLEVGLPATDILGYSFAPVRTLPLLEHDLPDPFASTELRCVAENTNIVMALGPPSGLGCVWLIDLEGQTPAMFVNTRIEWLGGFLSELVLHWQRCAAGEDHQASAAKAAQWMRATDADAMNESVGFWPTVLEELENGLL